MKLKPTYNEQKDIYFDGIIERSLMHGDYCSKRKKYYNNDTNKWIGRRLDSMKNTKDKRLLCYDFEEYPISKLKTFFSYEHIDRVVYFLTYLYRLMNDEERNVNMWVYISSDFCRMLLTQDWEEIVEVLTDLDVIEINKSQRNPYNRNKFKKHFRLRRYIFEGKHTKYYVYNTKLINSLVKRRKKIVSKERYLKYEQEVFESRISLRRVSLSSLFKQRVSRKKEEDYHQLLWDTIGVQKTNKIIKRQQDIGWNHNEASEYYKGFERRYYQLIDNIDRCKTKVEDLVVSKDTFAGRIYNPIIRNDREFRQMILLDNQPVVEIDMSTGYSSLFYTMLQHLQHNNRSLVPLEMFSALYDEKDGVFPYYVFDYIRDNEMYFGSNLDYYKAVGIKIRRQIMKFRNIDEIQSPVGNIGLFNFAKQDRAYIKDLIIRIINSNPLHHNDTRFIDKLFSFQQLQELIFTEPVSDLLNDIKQLNLYEGGVKKRNANITKTLILMEQKIMSMLRKRLINENIPYVSLHDGVLVGEKNKDFVLHYCNQISNTYPYIHFKSK